jgi:hypothetical protein
MMMMMVIDPLGASNQVNYRETKLLLLLLVVVVLCIVLLAVGATSPALESYVRSIPSCVDQQQRPNNDQSTFQIVLSFCGGTISTTVII